MKLGYIFLAAFVIAIGIVLFGEAGLVSAYKKSQDNAHLETRIESLQAENSRLQHEIEQIQKNPRHLEHTIRKSLSLLASDELLFEFQ